MGAFIYIVNFIVCKMSDFDCEDQLKFIFLINIAWMIFESPLKQLGEPITKCYVTGKKKYQQYLNCLEQPSSE